MAGLLDQTIHHVGNPQHEILPFLFRDVNRSDRPRLIGLSPEFFFEFWP